ncbi:MAG: hypothetical protein U0172_03440 [Nitrospiraceae bacterium]
MLKKILLAALAALVVDVLPVHATTILTSTDSIEIVTSSTAAIDYTVSYVDMVQTTKDLTPGSGSGQITTATTTTIVAAPASGSVRTIKELTLFNVSTTSSNTIVLQRDVSATNRVMLEFTLGPEESLDLDANGTVSLATRNGIKKQVAVDTTGSTGIAYDFYKIGTASEAIGVRYAYSKDTGLPAAWSPGTPGLNGYWTDCSVGSSATNPIGASQMGAPKLTNPVSGANYVTQVGMTTSTAHLVQLIDVVWVNTGAVVTTTTAQAITTPGTGKPSRDRDGSTNGEGWNLGIYVTTATTNASAVTNTTASYTNSDGTSGRTATMASFPATAVAGTLVPFELAAGDRGVRDVASVTLGTSYVSGAISLVLYRTIASIPNPIANVGSTSLAGFPFAPPGIRIHNGACIWPTYMSSATTATNLAGTMVVTER